MARKTQIASISDSKTGAWISYFRKHKNISKHKIDQDSYTVQEQYNSSDFTSDWNFEFYPLGCCYWSVSKECA